MLSTPESRVSGGAEHRAIDVSGSRIPIGLAKTIENQRTKGRRFFRNTWRKLGGGHGSDEAIEALHSVDMVECGIHVPELVLE